MSSYPTLPTRAAEIPQPVQAGTRAAGAVETFADGRAQIVVGGQPSGIYPSEEAAEAGLAQLRRMGVTS